MKLLLDAHRREVQKLCDRGIAIGQLLTPLTRYKDWGGVYGIDNGAFSGFPEKAFLSLLQRQEPAKDRCLWVCCPDVVGSGRRTLELWRHRDRWLRGWPAALVAQDGIEDLDIPWHEISALFLGGTTRFKESNAAMAVVRAAATLGITRHVGRVNTPARWQRFIDDADTCDGSGIARFDHMLDRIEKGLVVPEPMLFAAKELESAG